MPVLRRVGSREISRVNPSSEHCWRRFACFPDTRHNQAGRSRATHAIKTNPKSEARTLHHFTVSGQERWHSGVPRGESTDVWWVPSTARLTSFSFYLDTRKDKAYRALREYRISPRHIATPALRRSVAGEYCTMGGCHQ